MRNQDMSEQTKARLLLVARAVFTQQGYAATSLEAIAREAQLSRGALYHHFQSKAGLFAAVVESVQEDVARSIQQAAHQETCLWRQFTQGCYAFVEAALRPENRRILLIDGPAVIGWHAWSQMDGRHSEPLLLEQLHLLQKNSLLKPLPLPALCGILSGALNEAALWVAQREDIPQAIQDMKRVVGLLLDSLRAPGNQPSALFKGAANGKKTKRIL